jgi:hypothetical protein
MASVEKFQVQVVIEKNVQQNKRKLIDVLQKAIKTVGSDVKLVDVKME